VSNRHISTTAGHTTRARCREFWLLLWSPDTRSHTTRTRGRNIRVLASCFGVAGLNQMEEASEDGEEIKIQKDANKIENINDLEKEKFNQNDKNRPRKPWEHVWIQSSLVKGLSVLGLFCWRRSLTESQELSQALSMCVQNKINRMKAMS
jgi:hypothetical protein